MQTQSDKLVLLHEYVFYIPGYAGLLSTTFENRILWMTPEGYMGVRPEYGWDGGTFWPDGPIMDAPPPGLRISFRDEHDGIRVWTRPSLAHDPLYESMYELAEAMHIPVHEVRRIADLFLCEVAREDGAEYTWIVLPGARIFGGAYHKVMLWWHRIF